MGAESYSAILEDGPRWPIEKYVQILTESGCPCREEPDEWGNWVIFDGRESTLNFSVEDGAAVFVTFEMDSDDPPEFFATVERTFANSGWSTEEEA